MKLKLASLVMAVALVFSSAACGSSSHHVATPFNVYSASTTPTLTPSVASVEAYLVQLHKDVPQTQSIDDNTMVRLSNVICTTFQTNPYAITHYSQAIEAFDRGAKYLLSPAETHLLFKDATRQFCPNIYTQISGISG